MAVISWSRAGEDLDRSRPLGRTESAPSSGSRSSSVLDLVLADFTARWERGESPRAEDCARLLDPSRPRELVELVYREFCLAEDEGLNPSPDDYIARFPALDEALRRLLGVHQVLDPSGVWLRDGPGGDPVSPPEEGDEIGPYRLVRELGRGGFARVFLAEQSNLDDRLVVVKVSAKATPEPRLLARASHPHIVEVLWHGEAEGGGLQLICMPFLGGATLSAVLSLRRGRGGRPASGLDLLDDLDRASARGYPVAPASGRPAREVIGRLSYPRAVAWIVARLAEALDHAYSRGVIHGDVKPSNVLLTADGAPMLLDFNLSVGWRPHLVGGGNDPADIGGTLAYMAPERILAVTDPGNAPRPNAADRHRADVYALGVVLLEALTGRTPQPPGKNPSARPFSLRVLASHYISSRGTWGAPSDGPPRVSVSAALRAILARCLATDPADRYRRAAELAEDLDRWRTDQPLGYAREPLLKTALPRWIRRRRQVVAAAVTGLLAAAAVTSYSWRVARTVRTARAAHDWRVSRSEDSGAFLSRSPGLGVERPLVNPAQLARRQLERYGVIGEGDWRTRDEFAGLARIDREETEVWLMEQALRFARELRERSDTPHDRRRALDCLERAGAAAFAPLETEARLLRRLLNQAEPSLSADAVAAPRWMIEYLRGVSAEIGDDLEGLHSALRHYEVVLKERPASFWTHYRAAAVTFALADRATSSGTAPAAEADRWYASASDHLRVCVEQFGDCAVLHRQYAACLYFQDRLVEAAEQFDKALVLEPDHARTYMQRAFVKLGLSQFDDLRDDLDHYERLLGRAPLPGPVFALSGEDRDAVGPPRGNPLRDPGESYLRWSLGELLQGAGRHDLALGEFSRALQLDPDNFRARYFRALRLSVLHRNEAADADFELLAAHPRLDAYIQRSPEMVYILHRLSQLRSRQGRDREAVESAQRALQLSRRNHVLETDSSYNLAKVYASAARSDPSLAAAALEHLKAAYRNAPESARERVLTWFSRVDAFDDLRAEFGVNALFERD